MYKRGLQAIGVVYARLRVIGTEIAVGVYGHAAVAIARLPKRLGRAGRWNYSRWLQNYGMREYKGFLKNPD